LIDSGAGSNVIDEKTYQQMKNAPKLKNTRMKIFAFNSNNAIPVLGEFEDIIELEGRRCKDEFLVVKGAPGNLLSFKTAKLLDAFSLDIFKQIERENCCNINGAYEELMREFNMVFTDRIGCLKDCKVKLEINPDIKPIIQPYRRPPYHLAEATEKAIDELIREDIVEMAPEPIQWLSQLIIVPKDKKPNEVRITVDSRMANRAIIRQKFITPTLEEIKYDLKDAVIFSKLDCVKAFHQLELADEANKNITSFESSRGPLRYKRLHMGVHCASEIFQSKIRDALKGLEGVKNIADNILVHAKNKQEHDSRLKKLCESLRDKGLTVGSKNKAIGVEEIVFFGLKLSKEGVAISDEKANALKQATPPKNASELRSFLGLSIWCSFHIPNLATIAQPLWDLTREGTKYEWENIHKKAFENIKEHLVTKALNFYNVE
jgi:hypothetical protein